MQTLPYAMPAQAINANGNALFLSPDGEIARWAEVVKAANIKSE